MLNSSIFKLLKRFKIFKIPIIITIVTILIVGWLFNFIFDFDLPLIPLAIIAFFSSLISCFYHNRTSKKLQNIIQELSNGEKVDKDSETPVGNKYYNQIFTLSKKIINEFKSLEDELAL